MGKDHQQEISSRTGGRQERLNTSPSTFQSPYLSTNGLISNSLIEQTGKVAREVAKLSKVGEAFLN